MSVDAVKKKQQNQGKQPESQENQSQQNRYKKKVHTQLRKHTTSSELKTPHKHNDNQA